MTDTPSAEDAIRLTLPDLNSRLCAAVGLDADEIRGFELRTLEGDIPELVVYPIHPHTDDGALLDEWSAPLGETMRGTSLIVLPGGVAEAPPVRQPAGPLAPGVQPPAAVQMEVALCTVLPMLADVLNGAGCDVTTRAWLTSAARSMATEAERRVHAAVPFGGTIAGASDG